MILDSHLILELHVKKVWRSANYQLHRISRMRKCFDDATCAILVSWLVFPIWTLATRYSMVSLSICLIVCNEFRTQQSDWLCVLVDMCQLLGTSKHWLPVRYRIEFKIAALTYRCIYGLAPSYLAELVT